MTASQPAPADRLTALWMGWRPVVRRLALTVRPPLLPHLRAVDRAQAVDIAPTLALSGFRVTGPAVAAALARAGTRAHEAGWPGPLPPPVADPVSARSGVSAAALAALDGWVAALGESRVAILALLQGDRPDTFLPAAVPAWREVMTRPAVAAGLVPSARSRGLRRHELPGAPGPSALATCLARMWSLAAEEPGWDVRAALLHLAVLWIRPWPGANARVARLLLNTQRAAAGHPWLLIPATAAKTYHAGVSAALTQGDAGLFSDLLHACSAHGSRPPA
jgi:hypothetical protein